MDTIERHIDDLLANMTLHEKVGQMYQEYFTPDKLDRVCELIRKGELGSIILASSSTAGNDAQHATSLDIINKLQKTAIEESPNGIPIIIGRDVIHGHRTVLPIPIALAATYNPEIVYEGYRCVAKEASNDGIHWSFSPMMDTSRDPRWGRCVEGSGEDPYLGGEMAKAAVRGFQGDDLASDDSIAACAKHYIGYGASEGGRDYEITEISDYTLRNSYLPPFREAVNAGVRTVMSSFNVINGNTVLGSEKYVRELLKTELGFDGFVVSDWASIMDLIVTCAAEDEKTAAELAVNAGLDMEMVSTCYAKHLEALVEEGKVDIALLDDAVRRILRVKLELGLFDNPYAKPLDIDWQEHEQAAEKCSDESIVLLKNNNDILPIKKDKKILFAGPMLYEKKALCGTWALDTDIDRVKSIADVLSDTGVDVKFPPSPYLPDSCLPHIPDCDAVAVVLGESQSMTGESNSLTSIDIPKEQLEWVKRVHKHKKPIIGVMCFGRPIALEEIEPYLDAIVYVWHSGTRTAQSVVSVLYGDVNPSGKLPMTFPRTTGQVPIYYNHLRCRRRGKTYYDETSARVYHDSKATPMYPFGYGLSYTEFEYNDIQCDRAKLTLDELKNGNAFEVKIRVRNIGQYDGKEVTQCYISDNVSSMVRPNRELRAFSKNLINKGDEKEITFNIGYDELAFYNGDNEYVVEKGKFTIFIGSDCYCDTQLTVEVI